MKNKIREKIFNEFDFECDCGCTLINVAQSKEDCDVYLTVYFHPYQYKVHSIWRNIWSRIKAAWFMLCGKEYLLYEMVFNKNDEVKELKKLFAGLEE
jgi:hypothetical protein